MSFMKIENFLERNSYLNYTFIILVSVSFFSDFLTNSFTPGGDGRRIFEHLINYQHFDSIYPLWNYYGLGGGVPFIAEPERFFWLNALLDVTDPYFNIKLNILFLSLFSLVNILLFHLFRQLGFLNIASLIAMSVFSFSDSLLFGMIHGRINNLINYIAIFFAVIVYIKYATRGKPVVYYLVIPFLFGIMIQSTYYYALIYWVIFFIFALYYSIVSKKITLKKVLADSIVFTVIGILLFAFTIFPMADYMLFYANIVNLEMSGMLKLPEYKNLLDMFSFSHFLDPRGHFYFRVPFVVILTLWFLVSLFKKLTLEHKKVSIILSQFLLLLIFFLLGTEYPFRYLIDVWNSLPLLNKLRHAIVFYMPFALILAVMTAIVLQTIQNSNKNGKTIFISLFIIAQSVFLYESANSYYRNVSENSLYEKPVVFANDKTFYAVYNDMFYDTQYNIRHLRYFSGYTPVEYRIALEKLYGKELYKQKAHWIYKRNLKSNYAKEADKTLRALNVKYILLKSNYIPNEIKDNWKKVGSDKNREVYENPNWKSQFKYFTNYKCISKESVKKQFQESLYSSDNLAYIMKDCNSRLSNSKEDLKIRNLKITSDSLQLSFDKLKESGVLQVPIFYDKYWSFYINGNKIKSNRINGIYNGLTLKPGTEKVEMKYEPKSLYIGVLISVSTLISVLVYILYARMRKNNKR